MVMGIGDMISPCSSSKVWLVGAVESSKAFAPLAICPTRDRCAADAARREGVAPAVLTLIFEEGQYQDLVFAVKAR